MSRPIGPFANREVRRLAERYDVDLSVFNPDRRRYKVLNKASGTAIPTAPAELEEMMADSARMQAVFADPDKLKTLIKNYAAATMSRDPSIATQVREETERCMIQWLKDNEGDQIRRLNQAIGQNRVVGQRNRGAAHNPNAPGAQLDGEFKDTADFARAIWHNNVHPDNVARLNRIRNAFSSVVPSDGGFLVPESMRSELMKLALETAIVRRRARVIPMDALRVAFPAIDTTSNVSSVYGGIIGYWTEEGGALTQSQAKFQKVQLEAWALTALARVPNTLISDSMSSFAALIDELFPEALAFFEDTAFFSGNGVGQPLGFLRADAAISITKETGQPAASIVWENIIKMFARMLPTSLGRAEWYASPDTFPELAAMALSVGTGGSAVWLNNGSAGPPMAILGRPVTFTEKVSLLGTAGDINFADLGYYLVGDRQQMEAMSSPHSRFSTNETEYRFIQRVDGQPWVKSAITPANNGPTLSPFVKVATRA